MNHLSDRDFWSDRLRYLFSQVKKITFAWRFDNDVDKSKMIINLTNEVVSHNVFYHLSQNSDLSWVKWSLASRDSQLPLLKKLIDWVSWHQKVWASNAENEMNVSRIFRNFDFRNFNFQKFYVHNTHQI
jgi:hypothetical protein